MWVSTTAVTPSGAGSRRALGAPCSPDDHGCRHGARLTAGRTSYHVSSKAQPGPIRTASAGRQGLSIDTRAGRRCSRSDAHDRRAVRAVISVVVPVRNGMPWLEDQLQALVDQECDGEWELVIADNGSTDRAAGRGPMVPSGTSGSGSSTPQRCDGAPAARNAGVRAARGDLLAFCDADDVVQPGWLASCARALEEVDVVAGVFDFWSLNGLPCIASQAGIHAATRASCRPGWAPTWPSAVGPSKPWAGSPRSCSPARTSTCAGDSSSRDTVSSSRSGRWCPSGTGPASGGVPAGGRLRPRRSGPLPAAPSAPGPGGTWPERPSRGCGCSSTCRYWSSRATAESSGPGLPACGPDAWSGSLTERVFFP